MTKHHVSRFTAFLDANIFYPFYLRDLILRIHKTGLFRAKWTNEIHEEWIRNLLKNKPGIGREKLESLRDLINSGAEDCIVENYDFMIDSIKLPDLDDRHIVAAAFVGQADIIVTYNQKDFPEGELKKFNLESVHPDQFICNNLELDNRAVFDSIRKARTQYTTPSVNPDEYIRILQKQKLPQTASTLFDYREWI